MTTPEDLIKVCDVGDKYYIIRKNKIECMTIVKINKNSTFGHYTYYDENKNWYIASNLHRSWFETEEEAKEELQKRKKVKEKRKLLKEYEKKLNEELGLKDHFVIL